MFLQGSVGIWCLTHGAPASGGAGVSVGLFQTERDFGLLAAPKVELQGGNARVLNRRCEQSSPGKEAAGAWDAGEYRTGMWGLPSPGGFPIVMDYKPQQMPDSCFFFPAPPLCHQLSPGSLSWV